VDIEIESCSNKWS